LKNVVTLRSGSEVTQGHWTDMDRSATCDFLLTLHSNLSRTVSEINGIFDFSQKSPFLPGYRRWGSRN